LLRPLLDASIDTGLKTIVAGGGVAANSLLREKLAEHKELKCIFPSLKFCTDNAAMIGAAAFTKYMQKDFAKMDLNAVPGLELGEE